MIQSYVLFSKILFLDQDLLQKVVNVNGRFKVEDMRKVVIGQI